MNNFRETEKKKTAQDVSSFVVGMILWETMTL